MRMCPDLEVADVALRLRCTAVKRETAGGLQEADTEALPVTDDVPIEAEEAERRAREEPVIRQMEAPSVSPLHGAGDFFKILDFGSSRRGTSCIYFAYGVPEARVLRRKRCRRDVRVTTGVHWSSCRPCGVTSTGSRCR